MRKGAYLEIPASIGVGGRLGVDATLPYDADNGILVAACRYVPLDYHILALSVSDL